MSKKKDWKRSTDFVIGVRLRDRRIKEYGTAKCWNKEDIEFRDAVWTLKDALAFFEVAYMEANQEQTEFVESNLGLKPGMLSAIAKVLADARVCS